MGAIDMSKTAFAQQNNWYIDAFMKTIVLLACNARYHHCSHSLRVLLANMGSLKPSCRLLEFTEGLPLTDVAEAVLRLEPAIIGFSTYIWSEPVMRSLAGMLRAAGCKAVFVFGGPEFQDPADLPPAAGWADFIVSGEGEEAFPALCSRIITENLAGGSGAAPALFKAAPVKLEATEFPYSCYTDDDLRERTVYVESSRGCRGACAFCLSPVQGRLRTFPTAPFLEQLSLLHARGLRRFKFLDRDLLHSDWPAILPFLRELGRQEPVFVHFELSPGRLPEGLFEQLELMPPGSVQLEVGVQSTDAEVLARIGRPPTPDLVLADVRRLSAMASIWLHCDLLAGLPGQTMASIAAGLDALWKLGVAEIQLVPVKRLRGSRLSSFNADFAQVWNAEAPYDLLTSGTLSFEQLQDLRHFSKLFEKMHNSGGLLQSTALLMREQPFEDFMGFVRWVKSGRQGQPGMDYSAATLARLLLDYLLDVRGLAAHAVEPAFVSDLGGARGRSLPRRLQALHDGAAPVAAGLRRAAAAASDERAHLPRRQRCRFDTC